MFKKQAAIWNRPCN